jgi:carboxymethylenebutenolidase
VLHAWWGLNDTIKDFCSRLSDAGFVVFAPDLYHGTVTTEIPEAEELSRSLGTNAESANEEIMRAEDYLQNRLDEKDGKIGVVGFSMGASYALDAAAADPAHIHSVVLFYGTGGGDFSTSRAAYLGHFAEKDQFEPQSGVEDLEKTLMRTGAPVIFYTYPGTGHWFFEPDRSDAYNEEAATLAWDRTLAFLESTL